MGVEVWRSQNSFAGGIISEKMFGRVELEQYQDSVAILTNNKVLPQGGFTRRSGTKFGWEVKYSPLAWTTRLIPFEFSADDSYIVEASDLYFRFGKDGSLLFDGLAPVELVTPYTKDQVRDLRYVQSADTMWIVHPAHQPRKLLRYSDTEWYLDPVSFIDGPYLPINSSAITMVASAATGSVTVTALASTVSVVNASSGGTGKIRIDTDIAHGLTGGETVTLTGIVGTVEANGTWTATVISNFTFTINVTFVNLYISGGAIGPNVFAATDVGRHIRIWEATGAKWAWGEISGYTSNAIVTVEVIENSFPIVDTLLWRLGKFSDTTGWPAAVMLHEQRVAYAGAPLNRQDVDFSQTNQFNWFQTAADETLLDTDALSWSLFSNQVDNISWMIPARGGLAIGTSGGCWIMTGAGGKDDPLTPSSVNASKHEAIGVSQDVQANSMDNAVIFVDKAGRRVHEFAYLWEDDTYRAPDLTILSDHLTRAAKIIDFDVQKTSKVIWFALDDGSMIGLTYMRAENVVAWHYHQFAATSGGYGKVKSIAAVTETAEEVPYFLIEREVNGSTVQYVEYLQEDFDGVDISLAFFLDSGVSGTMPADGVTITGLGHLEGETIFALINGRVVPNLVVTGGAVTSPVTFTLGDNYIAGLNYFSDVETLPLELSNIKSGSTVGRVKDVGKTSVRVTDSYGAKMGRTFVDMEEVVFNDNLIMGSPPTLFSGEKSLDKIEGHPATDVRICIRQDIPLPLTVNSLVTRLLITED